MTVANSESETPDAGYSRGLSARTVQMIAIGGAIGTGLFYGAGGAIEKAGPGLILTYLVAGLAIFVIMRALGELLVYRPVSGSISEYAEEFMGRFAGFANGWTYWAVWATTCMAEITVAGVYIQRWWPGIPQWVTALVVLLILFGANLISVKIFGEAEFWFSMIKVTAILGMIIIGVGVLLPISGLGPETGPSVANLWNDGGVFPTGFSQALLSLQALSSRHVPMLAICFSALAMGIGVFVNWLSPDKAFAYITSVSTIGIIFVWGSILVSHMIYRKRVADGLLPASDYKLPGAPVTNILALGFLALVVLLLFFTEDGRTAILVGVVWFIIVVLGYFVHHGEPAHRETQDA